MPSVLAIVSRAVFDKQAADVDVGEIFETGRYTSTKAVFSALGKDDAIFLVSVRPPSETLWLVAILEQPTQKGKTWVGPANTTPIRDITPLIKLLTFVAGKGITAKKGALAMSLQTPRVLTDADVALLRGNPPGHAPMSPAVVEYTRQVALTPAAMKTKAEAEAAAASGQRFALRNRRLPFQMLKQLPKRLTGGTTRGAATPAIAAE